ncbi:LysR family transcriptional regulator [Marinobacterium lacunae]|uniref:LysR family transcriptional regulator n=1 Tax=Marinobacterium lacunae TaxID=1232683 RepID=A0A081G1H7_9GAMM|nr:LysR family transcriptional regulator [Marinobacterium lacunae]KEA64632.1 LysR family transcriptional regulator [Marinobacterium lacunae]MBR9884707.1 LysR family transcriptional regulator [Oceanospirillales bacterium]
MNTRKYWLGQVGDFEIKQLRVFTTVVQCGGFSAAEAELNITRSTISIHIANLESRLNLKLCHRGRAGFALTDEGRIIYESAQKLFDSVEEFRATVNNLNATLSGDLRLIFSDTVSGDPRVCLPELINAVAERAPDVYITVDVASMSEIEQMVINGQAEVGFVPIHRQIEGLDYIHLFTDTCRLYCHKSHPLFDRPDAELSEELIDRQPFVQAGLKPHKDAASLIEQMDLRATAYYYETRLALIRSGRYIGFLPEYYVANSTQPGELRALKPEQNHYGLPLGAIVRKSARPNKARELFISLLRERLNLPLTSAG